MPLLFTPSDLITIPTLHKPKDIVNFMVATQKRVYNEIIDLPFDVLVYHIKLLQQKYTNEDILWAIVWASQLCEHPYSIIFLEDFICQRRENLKTLKTYTNILEQNKS